MEKESEKESADYIKGYNDAIESAKKIADDAYSDGLPRYSYEDDPSPSSAWDWACDRINSEISSLKK